MYAIVRFGLICGSVVLACSQLSAQIGRRTFSADLIATAGFGPGGALTFLNDEFFLPGLRTGATSVELLALRPTDGNVRSLGAVSPSVSYADTDGVQLILVSFGFQPPDATVTFRDIQGAPVTTIHTANGPRTVPTSLTFPVGGAVGGIAERSNGFAYDRAGNAGEGSFLVMRTTLHGAGAVFEYALDGTPIRNFVVPSDRVTWPETMCIDHTSSALWIHDSNLGGGLTQFVRAASPVLQPTGLSLRFGVPTTGIFGAPDITLVPGGLDIVAGQRRSTGYDVARVYGGSELVASRVALLDGLSPNDEARLGVSYDGFLPDGLGVTVPSWVSTLYYRVDRAVPYVMFFNFEPLAPMQRPVGPIAPGLFPELWELRCFTQFTTPSTSAVLTLHGVGGSVEQLSYPAVRAFIGPGVQLIRAQAVYLDPGITQTSLPLFTTNDAVWQLL